MHSYIHPLTHDILYTIKVRLRYDVFPPDSALLQLATLAAFYIVAKAQGRGSTLDSLSKQFLTEIFLTYTISVRFIINNNYKYLHYMRPL